MIKQWWKVGRQTKASHAPMFANHYPKIDVTIAE